MLVWNVGDSLILFFVKNLFHYILAFFSSSTLCFIWLSLLPYVFFHFFLCSESLPLPCNYKVLLLLYLPPLSWLNHDTPQGHFRMDIGNWELNFSLQWWKIKFLYILLSLLQYIQGLLWSTICSRSLYRKIPIPSVGGETPSSSILWISVSCSLLRTLPVFSPLKWTGACEKSRSLLTQSTSFLEEKEWNNVHGGFFWGGELLQSVFQLI